MALCLFLFGYPMTGHLCLFLSYLGWMDWVPEVNCNSEWKKMGHQKTSFLGAVIPLFHMLALFYGSWDHIHARGLVVGAFDQRFDPVSDKTTTLPKLDPV